MSDNIKEIVREKYAQIARQSDQKDNSCCCCSSDTIDYSIMSDQYDNIDGYVPEADLHLGCGLPTEYAGINRGNSVVDLGSGAGNDVFIARKLVGKEGFVTGVDFTQEMTDKANNNKQKLGLENIDFKLGEIEDLPIEDNCTDVVISNCVLNLVPDKQKAFSEIYRILNPGGHFCVSDIVLKGRIPEKLREPAEMYAGCISGALQQEEYLNSIKKSGFSSVEIKKTKTIQVPREMLLQYLSSEEIEEMHKQEFGIYSITVVGYKK